MPYDMSTPILGTGSMTAAQIDAAFVARARGRNPNLPALGASIVAEGGASGINHDFLTAQILIETDGWTSARAVQSNNPAGIGSTDDGAWGNAFASPRAGIHAECAHWLTLIRGGANPWAKDDPRFDVAVRQPYAGHVSVIGDIGGGVWASAKDYATTILGVLNAISDGPGDAGGKGGATVVWPTLDELGIIDIRDRMAKAPGQGAGYTSAKDGVVIHYNGPPTYDPALERFISDSSFHIGPYLREYTIAYIYGIGDEPGDGSDAPIYLMRDPDDVCWHCGHWPENATYTPVAFTFGEGQSAGPGQINAAVKLIKALQQRDGFRDEHVIGHQEVDATACPGTLMDDLIYPFRAGKWSEGGYAPVSDYLLFRETGHGVGHGIRKAFEHFGGVPIVGLPISEEMPDPAGGKNPDGTPMTVQFFERLVAEYHPEIAAPNGYENILFRRLGAAAARAAGLTGPGID